MSAPLPSMPSLGRAYATTSADMPTPGELTMRVSVALLRRATLVTPRFTVGRYSGPCAPDGLAFACIDHRGGVVPSPEIEERATSLYLVSRIERHDWSAFGAARAFVANVPRPLVLEALRRARAFQREGT